MNNGNVEDNSMFEMSLKDLLMQMFEDGKRKTFEDGAISAANDVRTNLLILARISKNRDVSSMLIGLNDITTYLGASRDKIIQRLSKEELLKSNEFSDEGIKAVIYLIDSLQSFDFIKNDMVQGEGFLEVIKQIVIIVPPAEREKTLSELPRIIQIGFDRAVHEELPKSMEGFFDNILDAIDRESVEDILETIELEKLRWHSVSYGFP